MTENSYLNAMDIKDQCSRAVFLLEKDNESFLMAEKSLDSFYQDKEIKGSAFDALKQQLHDYKIVLQALRSANDSDIADFHVLSVSVGEDVLDGRNILAQQEANLRAKSERESAAAYYEGKARNTIWIWMEWYYKMKADQYWDLADGYRSLYEAWKAKEAAYDSIESATGGLFTASGDTRTAAYNGLKSMAAAFTGGEYKPDKDAPWRKAMETCYINRVLKVTAEGEITVDLREAEKMLNKDATAITPGEYDAIALAYLNADEEELGYFLQYMMGEKEDVECSIIQEIFGAGAGMYNRDYTEWQIDQRKVSELQGRLVMAGEVSLSLIQVFRQEPGCEQENEMIRQRNIILQRTTLLDTAAGIGAFRGEYQADYPTISVSSKEKGLEVKFCEFRNIGSESSPTFSSLGESGVTIGGTLLGSYIDNQAITNAEECLLGRFGSYPFYEEAAKFTVEEISGETFSDGMEAVSDYMKNILDMKALAKIVGYVPIAGDIAGFLIEAKVETAQAEADTAFIQEQFTTIKSAEVYGEFDCCANYVQYDTADNTATVICVYPGERTDEIISKLNQEFGVTLDREQVLYNPDEVWEWVEEVQKNQDDWEKYDSIIKNKE